jgi:hypothetical protein
MPGTRPRLPCQSRLWSGAQYLHRIQRTARRCRWAGRTPLVRLHLKEGSKARQEATEEGYRHEPDSRVKTGAVRKDNSPSRDTLTRSIGVKRGNKHRTAAIQRPNMRREVLRASRLDPDAVVAGTGTRNRCAACRVCKCHQAGCRVSKREGG